MDVTASLIAVADLPLFLDQNGARRAKKKFLDRPPYLKVWIRHWIESQPQGKVQ